MMNQMHLTLPSNSSTRYHPNNTLTNFRTRLQKELHLGEVGSWEVGLSELHYPHNWNNILPEKEKHADHRIWIQTDAENSIIKEIILEEDFFTTIAAVVRRFNEKLDGLANIEWVTGRQTVRITVYENHALFVSPSLEEMWGFREGRMEGDDSFRTFQSRGSYEQSFEGKPVNNKVPDLVSLYVYCDLAMHQMVGNTQAPLLRIVPVTGAEGDNVTYIYENIQYVPCRGGSIQNVEVDIRDDTGKPIHFDGGRVIVTLHIRRARSLYFQP